MRKLLLAVCFCLSLGAGTARAQFCDGAPPYVFVDVLASDAFCPFITQMAVLGITEGCEIIDANARRYCPNDTVSRKQMAAFLGRLVLRVQPLFAVITSDGVLVRGRGVTSVTKLGGSGAYEVIFDRDVSKCAYTASVGPPTTGTVLGEVNIATRGGNDNGVFVDTNTSEGAAADKSFHLHVIC